VNNLAVELVKKSINTYVVTYDDYLSGYHEGKDGIKAYRLSNPVKDQLNVLTWSLTLNQEFERAVADIYYAVKHKVDLIDVHDWHCIPAAVTLKKGLNTNFVFSVDSLEDHRSHGANFPLNLSIKSIEWLGAYESRRLLVKSDWMKQQVNQIYKVPLDKIDAVSPYSLNWINGIVKSYKKAIHPSLNKDLPA
jgi:hypothetical protein